MAEDPLKSKAFQQATLKSESYRVVGLLCLLGVLMIFVIARGLITRQIGVFVSELLLLAIMLVHEFFMLRAIRAALRGEGEVAPAKWLVNVFIESQLPTATIFLLLASEWLTPFQDLVAPALLIYFPIIILSTLRLNPTMTFMSGLLSALGYLLLVFFVEIRYQDSPAKATALDVRIYIGHAILIFGAGIIAAVVTRQVLKHVAAALREAELQSQLDQVTHDLDVARSIQQNLLPSSPPGLEEFDVAGWNQPADQTGGDYFDWQTLPDGKVAISLGDATGHGIGPALVSTSCRAYARASVLANGGHDGLLDRLNKLLSADLSANRFVTFAVVFLDPARAHVRILSAGHGPILWCEYASGKIENIEAQGIPLGMIAGIKYSQASEKELAAGDSLLLVTDGFYEWENPEGEQFGIARLEEVIRASRGASSEEIIEKLRDAVKTFCRGTKQMDDLTAVILKRRHATNGKP
jgi:serine phosphatase RsbU (regulator of sigma subunit)